jgi:cis-3-alkyl-4-acyloxetan-2-one decarboxylase
VIKVAGVDVHVEGEGEGAETVLMVHGWPDTYRLWDTTVEALKDRYRCVRFTLPGYDKTQPARQPTLDELVATYAAVVDAVSPDAPVTLLIHDWGCVFGYQYAMRHPARVGRIVAVDIGDTNSKAFMRSLSFRAKAGVAGYQLWLALAWKLRGDLGTRMTRNMARWLRCPSDLAPVSWQMNYPYWLTWTGGLRGAARVAPECPLLYIYGARKPFMFHSPQWIERVGSRPGCAVAALATGHWVMLQKPGEFNDAVRRWLDG